MAYVRFGVEAGDLYYATNATGAWLTERIATGPTSDPSTAVGVDGSVHVAFRDATDTALHYAVRCR